MAKYYTHQRGFAVLTIKADTSGVGACSPGWLRWLRSKGCQKDGLRGALLGRWGGTLHEASTMIDCTGTALHPPVV